jgi:hypothetical protein
MYRNSYLTVPEPVLHARLLQLEGGVRSRDTFCAICGAPTDTGTGFSLSTSLFSQLVEALRYKPESRGFDSRWSYWNFSVT